MAEKITINEIAELCGVSKATVSYVLNGKSTPMKISNATCRQIIDTCTRLGYKPDKTAQALSALRKIPLQILLLTPWLYAQHSDFMAQVNTAFQHISMEEEIRLSYGYFERNGLREHLNPEKYQKVDCVVIAGTSLEDDLFLQAHAEDYPNVVVLNRRIAGICSVYGNDYDAFGQLADSVVKARHYDSYVLLCDSADSYCRTQRMRALREALKDQAFSSVPLKELTHREDALEIYHSCRKGATCFIFLDYPSASLFMVHLLRSGVRIPEDCGIFCFDIHTQLQTYLPLQLTTVNPKLEKMVEAAYQFAKAMKEGQHPAGQQIQAELCPGETVITG